MNGIAPSRTYREGSVLSTDGSVTLIRDQLRLQQNQGIYPL